MPNVITKFLDKITGVEEESSYPYPDEEYVTVDLNEQQMKQLETVKTSGQITVKVHKLKADNEYQTLLDFVRNNNIVILDISLLKASDFTGLKMLSGKLKQKCADMGWGLGALSNDLLMITPTSVKFEKKKQEEVPQEEALVQKM